MIRFVSLGVFLLTALSAQSNAIAEAAPDGWKFVSVRDETAARSAVVQDGGAFGLTISSNGKSTCDGRWVKQIDLPQSKFVRLTARFNAKNIEMISRNVIATIVWLDDKQKEIGDADFAPTIAAADAQGWRCVDAVYPVPAKAKHAQIELRLRWSANGQVEWRDAELKSCGA